MLLAYYSELCGEGDCGPVYKGFPPPPTLVFVNDNPPDELLITSTRIQIVIEKVN